MVKKTTFENCQISNFEGLVTLTLDRVILHAVAHHSLISTYTPNFIEIEETFCGRTEYACMYVLMYARTDGRRTFETGFIRSTLSKSRHDNAQMQLTSAKSVPSPNNRNDSQQRLHACRQNAASPVYTASGRCIDYPATLASSCCCQRQHTLCTAAAEAATLWRPSVADRKHHDQ